jgi:hypothetical protein
MGSGAVQSPESSHAAGEEALLDIVLNDAFYSSPEDAKDRVLRKIAELVGQARVISLRRGSLILRVAMTQSQADRLLEAVAEGAMSELGVIDAKVVDRDSQHTGPDRKIHVESHATYAGSAGHFQYKRVLKDRTGAGTIDAVGYALNMVEETQRIETNHHLVGDIELADSIARLRQAIDVLLDDGDDIEPPPDLARRTIELVAEHRRRLRRQRPSLELEHLRVPIRWLDLAMVILVFCVGLVALLPAIHTSRLHTRVASMVNEIAQRSNHISSLLAGIDSRIAKPEYSAGRKAELRARAAKFREEFDKLNAAYKKSGGDNTRIGDLESMEKYYISLDEQIKLFVKTI